MTATETRAEPVLTVDAVMEIWNACVAAPGDPEDDQVRIDGASMDGRFSRTRLLNHRMRLRTMLVELPDNFLQSGGGGWTMLNGCVDRHQRFWTSDQRTVDRLVILGIGAGVANWTLERNLWDLLPSGMPYFQVLDGPKRS